MIYEGQELYHHGILGQKWGIRRYQNFDGSYTQAGLERYNKSKSRYEANKEAYSKIKHDPTASKYQKKQAKVNVKRAKRDMNGAYRHLKQDKLADKGKLRYQKGERITMNTTVNAILETVGTMSLGAAYKLYQANGKAETVNLLTAIGGASLGASAVKRGYNYFTNNQLRAYYAHSPYVSRY